MNKSDVLSYLNPKALELILLPTENCNFRCSYCYEDFEIGRMQEETVTAIKNLIVKRMAGLDRIQISWFGGEPLMATDIVQDISRFCQEVAAGHGVRYSSGMTTNAFALIPSLFDKLLALGVRHYQISLDGDQDLHDTTRKLISGKGTFNKIWENLLAMRNSKERFGIVLRVHVHEKNLDSVKVLLKRINHEFGADTRFTIFLKNVGNYGGERVKDVNLLKSPQEILEDLRLQLVEDGWFANRSHDGGPKSKACYAAKPNSLVVRATGKIAKCTVAFSDPRNDVGVLHADGSVSLNKELMRAFMRGFETLDAKALSCPVWGIPKSLVEPKPQVVQFVRKEEMAMA